MATVTGQMVADFLDQGSQADLVALAEIHVGIVTEMARAYTRDRGFTEGTGEDEPEAPIEKIIITATARLVVNPEQVRREGIGSLYIGATPFLGFTLAEMYILDRYRVKAG